METTTLPFNSYYFAKESILLLACDNLCFVNATLLKSFNFKNLNTSFSEIWKLFHVLILNTRHNSRSIGLQIYVFQFKYPLLFVTE